MTSPYFNQLNIINSYSTALNYNSDQHAYIRLDNINVTSAGDCLYVYISTSNTINSTIEINNFSGQGCSGLIIYNYVYSPLVAFVNIQNANLIGTNGITLNGYSGMSVVINNSSIINSTSYGILANVPIVQIENSIISGTVNQYAY